MIYTSVGVTSAFVFDRYLIVVVQTVKNKAYSVAFPQCSAPPNGSAHLIMHSSLNEQIAAAKLQIIFLIRLHIFKKMIKMRKKRPNSITKSNYISQKKFEASKEKFEASKRS